MQRTGQAYANKMMLSGGNYKTLVSVKQGKAGGSEERTGSTRRQIMRETDIGFGRVILEDNKRRKRRTKKNGRSE